MFLDQRPRNDDKRLFKEEIKGKAVKIKTVQENIAENVQLKDEDPKKILDKVRVMWRFPSSTQSEPVNLPEEQETLEQRVERPLDVNKSRSWEIQTTTTEASGVHNLFFRNLKSFNQSSATYKIKSVFRERMIRDFTSTTVGPNLNNLVPVKRLLHISTKLYEAP